MPQITLLTISQGFKLCFIGIQKWYLYPPQFFGYIFWSSVFSFLFFFFLHSDLFVCFLVEMWSSYISQTSFECTILLPQPSSAGTEGMYYPFTIKSTLREFLFCLAVSYVESTYTTFQKAVLLSGFRN